MGLASKLSEDDKSTVNGKIDETTAWLDANQTAEKEEYEAKQKELEAIVNPILQNVAGGAPGAGGMPDMGGMPGGMPDMGGAGFPGGAPATDAPPPADVDEGPKIEEID